MIFSFATDKHQRRFRPAMPQAAVYRDRYFHRGEDSPFQGSGTSVYSGRAVRGLGAEAWVVMRGCRTGYAVNEGLKKMLGYFEIPSI